MNIAKVEAYMVEGRLYPTLKEAEDSIKGTKINHIHESVFEDSYSGSNSITIHNLIHLKSLYGADLVLKVLADYKEG